MFINTFPIVIPKIELIIMKPLNDIIKSIVIILIETFNRLKIVSFIICFIIEYFFYDLP